MWKNGLAAMMWLIQVAAYKKIIKKNIVHCKRFRKLFESYIPGFNQVLSFLF